MSVQPPDCPSIHSMGYVFTKTSGDPKTMAQVIYTMYLHPAFCSKMDQAGVWTLCIIYYCIYSIKPKQSGVLVQSKYTSAESQRSKNPYIFHANHNLDENQM